ncbi:MAG: transglutaminaseTgpA domain-containing protein [Propionibacteriaceae bacterium]|jgi:transglutaminase-like putative cysteine protease|nr:transglutaminaseTgpA domain-containing protein [Propionibacteriaceae bacterium]
MTRQETLTIALLPAWALSCCALFPATLDREWLWLAIALATISAIIGTILRRLGLAEFFVKIVQAIPGSVFLYQTVIANPTDLLWETAYYVIEAAPPMEPHDGFRVLTAFALWVFYLILDLLVISFNQVCWSFPILFAPYLISALGILEDVDWWYVCFGAAGFLLVLIGSAKARNPAAGLASLLGLGAAMGVFCLAGSIGLSPLLPNWSVISLNPSSPDAVTLADPSVDIVRNLRRSEARPVLKYAYTSGEAGNGTYLRLAALPVFTSNGFGISPTQLEYVDRDLPGQAGITSTDPVELKVEIGSFVSQYLPLPWGARSVDVTGQWGYDPVNSALVSLDENAGQTTVNLGYELTASPLSWTDEELATRVAGNPADNGLTLSLPAELPESIRSLAESFNAGGPTAGQLLLNMRDWLRSSEFRYSTATQPGTPMDTIEDFLLSSRTGYCEQFAAALAIMARSVGIPSRVVVGFLPGSLSNGIWSVDTHDMHAWTELYLDGLGWIPLDATPGGANPNPTSSPSNTPSVTPSSSTQPSTAPSQSPTATPLPGGQAFNLPGWVPTTGGIVLALGLLLCAPRWTRAIRTRRRLSPRHPLPARVEDCWDELRDRLIDAGQEWPTGTVHQVTETLVAGVFADDEKSSQAVTELALLVEQFRFAKEQPSGDPAALIGKLGLTSKNRWFPRSLFRFRRPPGAHSR